LQKARQKRRTWWWKWWWTWLISRTNNTFAGANPCYKLNDFLQY
jgi:hypothetical protein